MHKLHCQLCFRFVNDVISGQLMHFRFLFSANFRPSLTRAETIESCNSDDLVTVLEMHNRKPYKIIDRKREVKKGVMAESLEELISRGWL